MTKENTITDFIKYKQLNWYGQVEWMEDERIPRRVHEWIPSGRRRGGRPSNTWLHDVMEAMYWGLTVQIIPHHLEMLLGQNYGQTLLGPAIRVESVQAAYTVDERLTKASNKAMSYMYPRFNHDYKTGGQMIAVFISLAAMDGHSEVKKVNEKAIKSLFLQHDSALYRTRVEDTILLQISHEDNRILNENQTVCMGLFSLAEFYTPLYNVISNCPSKRYEIAWELEDHEGSKKLEKKFQRKYVKPTELERSQFTHIHNIIYNANKGNYYFCGSRS
ncbi:hypothetical protein C0J52_26416 [Blattella germanica]|nr:hypothetical protein C0J52_26416 [Blattella germanica]